MRRWLQQLQHELTHRQSLSLRRQLRAVDQCARIVQLDGRPLINLASNDYLALAGHPHIRQAVVEAIKRFGVGAGASRLVTGDLHVHRQLEERFAVFKHAEAALLTPTGYMANLAVLSALAGPDDVVLMDKLNHASLIDAARASGATVRIYPHRNLDKLHRLLQRTADARRRLIVTDAVFSMDGDCADLPALCELRDQFDAILIVDEAHATGVLGESGAGLAERQGVAGHIDVTISTAGKALGSLGGIVTAPQLAIDTLINQARTFIYTTAPPVTQVAAVNAALDVIEREPDRRLRLADLSQRLRSRLQQRGWPVADDPTPIVPLIVRDPAAALKMAERLEAEGFLIPAIRPPTVPPDSARLRVSLRADLLDDDIDRLIAAVGAPSDGVR
ncbi:8-amino-7-oxononanoate synthase [Planctomycetales bacterium ZRK34]|nr:8-amino-7-oxononanoate synthase [Planctomycetales bacterium ZRK34]